jgi:hypothetical protein
MIDAAMSSATTRRSCGKYAEPQIGVSVRYATEPLGSSIKTGKSKTAQPGCARLSAHRFAWSAANWLIRTGTLATPVATQAEPRLMSDRVVASSGGQALRASLVDPGQLEEEHEDMQPRQRPVEAGTPSKHDVLTTDIRVPDFDAVFLQSCSDRIHQGLGANHVEFVTDRAQPPREISLRTRPSRGYAASRADAAEIAVRAK